MTWNVPRVGGCCGPAGLGHRHLDVKGAVVGVGVRLLREVPGRSAVEGRIGGAVAPVDGDGPGGVVAGVRKGAEVEGLVLALVGGLVRVLGAGDRRRDVADPDDGGVRIGAALAVGDPHVDGVGTVVVEEALDGIGRLRALLEDVVVVAVEGVAQLVQRGVGVGGGARDGRRLTLVDRAVVAGRQVRRVVNLYDRDDAVRLVGGEAVVIHDRELDIAVGRVGVLGAVVEAHRPQKRLVVGLVLNVGQGDFSGGGAVVGDADVQVAGERLVYGDHVSGLTVQEGDRAALHVVVVDVGNGQVPVGVDVDAAALGEGRRVAGAGRGAVEVDPRRVVDVVVGDRDRRVLAPGVVGVARLVLEGEGAEVVIVGRVEGERAGAVGDQRALVVADRDVGAARGGRAAVTLHPDLTDLQAGSRGLLVSVVEEKTRGVDRQRLALVFGVLIVVRDRRVVDRGHLDLNVARVAQRRGRRVVADLEGKGVGAVVVLVRGVFRASNTPAVQSCWRPAP